MHAGRSRIVTAGPSVGSKRLADIDSSERNRGGRKRRRGEREDHHDDSPPDESEEFLEVTKDTLTKSCQIHHATPLRRFETRENSFKRYGKRLKVEIMDLYISKSTSVDDIDVEWKLYPSIQTRGPDREFSAFVISVFGKKWRRGTDEPDRSVLSLTIFVKNGRTPTDFNNERLNFPIVITRGKDKIFAAIQQNLRHEFGCWIVPFKKIMPEDVKIIAGNWLINSFTEDSLDMRSRVTFEFRKEVQSNTGEISQISSIKVEGDLPIKYIEPHLNRYQSPVFCFRSVIRMWHDVTRSVTGALDLTTPVTKIKCKNFQIGCNGKLRAKEMSLEIYLELFTSLIRCAEEGSDRFTRPVGVVEAGRRIER